MRSPSEEPEAPATVSMTEEAARRARHILENEPLDPEAAGVRLYVQQGGCAGLSYGMRVEAEPDAEDRVFESNGIRLIVDEASLEHVRESRLSFEDSQQGAGFVVENPNAVAECGCGESFHT